MFGGVKYSGSDERQRIERSEEWELERGGVWGGVGGVVHGWARCDASVLAGAAAGSACGARCSRAVRTRGEDPGTRLLVARDGSTVSDGRSR